MTHRTIRNGRPLTIGGENWGNMYSAVDSGGGREGIPADLI